ncbi:MAG: phosphoglycerate mutase, partial [Candidatus Micrarchaeia archaeon]
MQRKAVFLMIDGLGSLPAKGRKTELELAKTPNLDALARNGVCGLMHPIGVGIIPGSDTSQLNILGYPPEKFYPGRGPLEALGAGMHLEEGNVAFRANFATVDDRFVVVDRRAGRIATQDASGLAKSIASISIDGFEFAFKSTVEHRGVVVVRGKGTTGDVGDTDPHATGVPVRQPNITAQNAALVRA